MLREFRLPDIGEGLTEAEIVRWLVGEGDTVAVDEPIVEIETDKAMMEIPSPFAGVVVSFGASEGTVLAVGEVLVTVESDEQNARSTQPSSDEAAPIVGTLSTEAVDLTPRPRPGVGLRNEARTAALPIVRKLAKEHGIDLADVTGTGPDGQITRDDVRRNAGSQPPSFEATDEVAIAEESSPRAVSSPIVASEPPPEVSSRPERDQERGVPMSKLRRTIAERTTASWSEIPQVTAFDSVDVTRLFASRTALRQRRNAPVSIDAMVVMAVVTALAQHRDMTARLVGDLRLEHPDSIDIGVAVDTADGLMLVVVGRPGDRDLVDLTAEISRLAEGARNRSLAADALTGQAFTISNIGSVGGGFGTPIVPYGTTGILSVGRAVDSPIVRSGRLEIAPMMPLSLSYDHRVIDGAAGRRFLKTVMENLEEPTLFLA